MRDPKAAWVRALRDLTGVESDTIRFNEEVWRWEFVLQGADGIPRSQFYGWFDKPVDPVTGMHPFRDLDDDGFSVVMRNLKATFVGNRIESDSTKASARTTHGEVMRRYQTNKQNAREKYMQAGYDFADMVAERGHRIRGAVFSGSAGTVASRARAEPDNKPLIEIPVVIGGGNR